MRHGRPVCTALCSHNASCSRHPRSSRSVIAEDCSFGHAGHQLRQSITLPGNLVVGRFGTSCYTHTDHHIDRFGDSDHLGLVCNHGRGPVDSQDTGPVDNQDTAPGQYRFRLSQYLKRQRMPVRAHLIFYSSNSLVLIPPLPRHRQLPCPRVEGLKNASFLEQMFVINTIWCAC